MSDYEEYYSRFPYPIKAHNGLVYVGPKSYDNYTETFMSNDFRKKVSEECRKIYMELNRGIPKGSWSYPNNPRILNKAEYNLFGRKPRQTFLKLNFKTFIADKWHKDYWKFFIHYGSRRKVMIPCLDFANSHKDQMLQFKEDGTMNLVPFYMAFGMNPSELKHLFGKSTWKKVANRSVTANLRILGGPQGILHIRTSTTDRTLEDKVSIITKMLDYRKSLRPPDYLFSATVLGGVRGYDIDGHYSACSITPTVKDFNQTLHMVRDTKRMSLQLQQPFNPEWSYKRMKEEHDKLSKMTLVKRHSKEVFCEPMTIGNFTKLTSEFEIALEGKEMHHCVGSYSNYASRGHYQVWKYDNGKERGTLGVKVYERSVMLKYRGEDKAGFALDQFYGPMNQKMSSEAEEEARKLLVILNEGLVNEANSREISKVSTV